MTGVCTTDADEELRCRFTNADHTPQRVSQDLWSGYFALADNKHCLVEDFDRDRDVWRKRCQREELFEDLAFIRLICLVRPDHGALRPVQSLNDNQRQ
jgi:hypothetical protein